MKSKIVLISISMFLIATFEVAAKPNPGGCKNANANQHNPNCHHQTTNTGAIQNPPVASVSTSNLDSHSVAATNPVVVTGTYGQGKTGFAPVPPNKTHKPDDGKYMTPQPYAVPSKPQTQPQVVTGTYGPSFTGVSPALPNKAHKPDDGKYMTPQPYAVPPKPQTQPQVVTGSYGPSFTGISPALPNKTHKPDDGKYMTPQPYAVPPKPQTKPQVVTGTYGPSFTGVSPVLPNKTHKPDDGKYMTPLPYAVPSKPQAQPQVVIGTYGSSWSGFSPVVVTPQKGTKPKHPHMVNVHTTQAKNPDHHPNHHIPSVAGKGMVDGHRSQFIQANGHVWTCALSGMSRRVIKDQSGKSRLVGHAETLHFRDSTTAHLPSNHRLEANCLVTVNKHAKQ